MWTERYCASLAPDGVALLRVRKGLRPALLEKWQAHGVAAHDAAPWRAGIAQLESLLAAAGRRLPLTVVLSNRLVRYRVIPALPPFMAERERQALIRHSFRVVYGEAADRWTLSANPLPDGDSAVACAIDSELLAELHALCRRTSLRLASVQPDFMTAFNRARRRITRVPTCFVQVEPGVCMLALLRDGAWHSLNAVPLSAAWQEELPALVQREMLLAGWHDTAPQILVSTREAHQASRAEANSSLLFATQAPVAGFAPLRDQPYAMALSGA